MGVGTYMTRKYHEELIKIISEKGDTRPGLLLHVCCAPCASVVLERLSPHFDITVFFYNPNIWPKEEYERRKEELKKLISAMSLQTKIIGADYCPDDFESAALPYASQPEGGDRCGVCFGLRLDKTARLAKEGGFDYFTTTLTVGPMKNAELINSIGEEAALKNGVSFLPSDFKKQNGYGRSIELCHNYGIYRQNYCGCEYSLR